MNDAKKILQFGGARNDYAYDSVLTSSGDIVISISTFSTSFLGLDLTSYTDGSTYCAFGLLLLNGTSLELKSSYWLSGNGKSVSLTPGGYTFRILIHNDIVYFAYGSSGSSSNDWHIYGVNTSDMTLSLTSNVAIDCGYDGAIAYDLYDGNIYVGSYYAANNTTKYINLRRQH